MGSAFDRAAQRKGGLVDPKDGSESYGVQKAQCEEIVRAAFGKGSIVVRPSYIVGPGDTSDRFPYWPQRLAKGGETLAPVVAEGAEAELVTVVEARGGVEQHARRGHLAQEALSRLAATFEAHPLLEHAVSARWEHPGPLSTAHVDLPAEVRAAVTPRTQADEPVGAWNTYEITVDLSTALDLVISGDADVNDDISMWQGHCTKYPA